MGGRKRAAETGNAHSTDLLRRSTKDPPYLSIHGPVLTNIGARMGNNLELQETW